MNTSWMYRLMDAAGEGDAGGGAAVDRGDALPELKPELTPEPEKAEQDASPAPEPEKVEPEPAQEADEQPRDEQGRFVPKGVFDTRLREQKERVEAAERRAAELEQQLEQLKRVEDTSKIDEEISALEDQLESARMDGNKEKALELSKALRMKERQLRVAEATHMSAQAKAEAYEAMRVDLAIERVEAKYDVLNAQHEQFDQDLTDLVLLKQIQLMQRERMSASEALVKAADDVMAKMAPKPAAAPEKKQGLEKQPDASRKGEQVQKNLETQKAQPPSMKEAGLDSDKAGLKGEIDVTKLTPDEFAALPESTKAKLRGDLV